MSGRSAARVWALVWVMALAPAPRPARAEAVEPPSIEHEASFEDHQGDLRERLTEREDKRRPAEPRSMDVAGRPLTLGGEYEIALGYVRRRVVGDEAVDQPDRLLLEQGLQVEAFYSFGPVLSLFAQLQAVMEEDLLSDTFEEISELFVERGEMWLYSEDIAGSHVNLDLGRLDFEDERRWWWDDELDAVRVGYETETFELTLALARELAPRRFDESHVEPDQERVLRVIGELSWDLSESHGLELFLLHQDDHSGSEQPGASVSTENVDESDARLTWLGARLMGVFALRSRGALGYWLDTAFVDGEESLLELDEISTRRSRVAGERRRDVRGWAFDAGANWLLPLAWEPRVFAGAAYGSGDASPSADTDRSFRQTGIQANEAGFGGVERFPHYGILLDPELSNLWVLTLGAGLSLLRSSSLDLAYHRYWLAEPATSLRDARLELTLAGERRDLGDEVDLVLALEEWERLELELAASAFRAGSALGAERGTWSYGGFLVLRYAF